LKKRNLIFCPHRIYEHWPVVEEPYERALDFIDSYADKDFDVLVSDESMYLKLAHSPGDTFIKDRFDAYDVKVVYLRRQDLHLESLVNYLQSQGLLPEQI